MARMKTGSGRVIEAWGLFPSSLEIPCWELDIQNPPPHRRRVCQNAWHWSPPPGSASPFTPRVVTNAPTIPSPPHRRRVCQNAGRWSPPPGSASPLPPRVVTNAPTILSPPLRRRVCQNAGRWSPPPALQFNPKSSIPASSASRPVIPWSCSKKNPF